MHAARTAPPGESFPYAIVTALADQKEIFSDVCGFSGDSFSVGPRVSVSRVPGAGVTGDYYDTLGVAPLSRR